MSTVVISSSWFIVYFNQFLVLNLDSSFCILSNKFTIFWYSIIISYYYINLTSLIIFRLCSRDIYLSPCISLSSLIFSYLFVTELFCDEVFEAFVILLAILFPIKSTFFSEVFWIALFEAVSMIKMFLTVFTAYVFTYNFTNIFSHFSIFTNIKPLGSTEYRGAFYMLYFKVMLISSSLSNGLEFWSINHTSIYENSESKVFKNIKCFHTIFNTK